MSFKGTFTFDSQKIIQTKINDNVFMRLERIGHAIAILYFLDEHDADIPIPDGLIVFDMTHGGVKVGKFIDKPYFILAWSDNYAVEMHGEKILGLTSQRAWTITGPKESLIETIL